MQHELIIRLAPTLKIISQTKHDNPVVGFGVGQTVGLGSPPAPYVIDEVAVQIGSAASGPLKTILVVHPAPVALAKHGENIGIFVGNA